jgi:chemotaxis protein methyltransferase CheR
MSGPARESEAQKSQSYVALCAYLRRTSGLVLDSDKRYLVESRVAPIVRREGFTGLTDLVRAMERGAHPGLAQEVVQAMTINETYFFRDKVPFDKLREYLLPELITARATRRSLRIWCAASSTGQEPYSIAMILEDLAVRMAGWRVEIVATDIATSIIDRAKAGLFSQFDVQRGLPIKYLMNNFTQEEDKWRVNAPIRNMVQFRPLNLLRDFAPLGQFDIVFCRNVLIYFDEAAKRDILTRIGRQTQPDGFFVMGAAETTVGLSGAFAPHPQRRGLFQRTVAAPAPAFRQIAAAG